MIITLGYKGTSPTNLVSRLKRLGTRLNSNFRYILRKRGMEEYNQHIDLLFLISVTDSDIILSTYPNHKSAGLIALYKRNRRC